MKRLFVTTVAVVALLVGGAVTALAAPAPAAPGGPPATTGPCAYTATPDQPAARPVPLPPDPRPTPNRGRIDVAVVSNQGYLPLQLDRTRAPCTVQSFLHLARRGFYDRTTCHRLTRYPTLKVLQCGDPTGTGEGGPGYQYRDELPTMLPSAPNDPTGQRRIYGRGLLAMANAGPNTNGSQFFIVYGDSALRPDYTVFGTVGPLGLRTVDRVAAAGVAPNAESDVDGPPARRTDLQHVIPLCLC